MSGFPPLHLLCCMFDHSFAMSGSEKLFELGIMEFVQNYCIYLAVRLEFFPSKNACIGFSSITVPKSL